MCRVIATVRYQSIQTLLFLLPFVVNSSHASADNQAMSNDCNVNKNNYIGAILVNLHPIFDEKNPSENNWLFRKVNALHINTNETVIKNDLLFKESDVYDESLIEQSERILRTRRYLNDVAITSSPQCMEDNEKTNVSVDVREVWTLLPEITFSQLRP